MLTSFWVTIYPGLLGKVVITSRTPFYIQMFTNLDNIVYDQPKMVYEAEWYT